MELFRKHLFFVPVLLMAAAPVAVSAESLLALTRSDNGVQAIMGIQSGNLAAPTFSRTLTGIRAGFVVNGIDFRASDGKVYALATDATSFTPTPSDSQLYTIDVRTGFATAVGGPIPDALTFSSGTRAGFDFNPQVDLIRTITDLDENIVVNPNNGSLAARATNVSYASGDVNAGVNPNVVDIAYNNNVAGTTTTQQYGIDVGTDSLVTVANNAGTLATVGSLGLSDDVGELGGFDISGGTGVAYAILTTRSSPLAVGVQSLYTIDLLSGLANQVGVLNPLFFAQLDGLTAIGSVQAVPEPATFALFGIGAFGVSVGLVRRKRNGN